MTEIELKDAIKAVFTKKKLLDNKFMTKQGRINKTKALNAELKQLRNELNAITHCKEINLAKKCICELTDWHCRWCEVSWNVNAEIEIKNTSRYFDNSSYYLVANKYVVQCTIGIKGVPYKHYEQFESGDLDFKENYEQTKLFLTHAFIGDAWTEDGKIKTEYKPLKIEW